MSKPAADSYDFAAYLWAWCECREHSRMFRSRDALPRTVEELTNQLDALESSLKALRAAAAALTGGPEPKRG